jgi:predicted nucleotidyltransferase
LPLLGKVGPGRFSETVLEGIHVDLRTPGDLPPKVRAKVLAQAQPV